MPPARQRNPRGRKAKTAPFPTRWVVIGIWAMVSLGAILAVDTLLVDDPADESANLATNEDATGTVTLAANSAPPPISSALPSGTASHTGSPALQGNSATVPKPGERGLSVDAARKASDELFDRGLIPELRIEIAEGELQKLRQGATSFVAGEIRPYVPATVVEAGGHRYENVALKLKGSAGSYRPVDDRPAFTINVNKFENDQTFHGLGKFHLNNSVQDPTYIHEWIASELLSEANVPATRVTHARVWLNGRDLGLYVLKSAFDKPFLKRHFGHAKGNLYEGGFVQDIDIDLEKDLGEDQANRADLKALLAACREPDLAIRWSRLEELLDIEQFLTFMALEMMLGHWDGYTLQHNNYRIFFDARSGKASFLPHGMDQVFGDPNASVINLPSSIAAAAVMNNRIWRARYRERLRELQSLFQPSEELLKRVDQLHARLRPVLERMGGQVAKDHDQQVAGLKSRLTARGEGLLRQQTLPDPGPRDFDESGRLALTEWQPVSETPDAKLEVVPVNKVPKAFSIQYKSKTGRCNSSWRCKVPLAKGKYTLHARMKTEKIVAANDQEVDVGAGIRIEGWRRDNVRKGTTTWIPVEFDFAVTDDVRTVEVVLELRARQGQVWFDAGALHLTRQTPP
ncbi:MAG TPA: hypothetical protein DDY91_16080 [Planctomycetaceae bacterium]|nr:hypothetical protein [Planctomycetaceae bacterium]